VDLNVFDFDYDLTWLAFFLSADEQIYGRYGGRDAKGAEDRLSLDGLEYAARAALAAHAAAKERPLVKAAKPQLVEEYASVKRRRGHECIHCHQVNEFRRVDRKEAGLWRREEIWVYPLPENVGLTLDVKQGDRVQAVTPDSPADRAGLRAGDLLRRLNDMPVHSFGDAQYALHRAPVKGPLAISWQHDGKAMIGRLELAEGWRKTNLTWRPSMLDLLPSLTLYGDDLTPDEKKALGLTENRLAFRQDPQVHAEARKVGVQAGDVIIGLDGQALEMTMQQFLGFVRRNYLVGDRIKLNIVRDGKRLDLPMTLR
jgi:predicted metalloprotease with PDZ domain